MSASVIMLPYVLVVSRIRIKSESKVETLFLLCEGATYETTKAKGTLDLLHTLICGGYFQKMYAVNFPALKNATIYVFGSLDMIEIASIGRFLKRHGFSFTYMLINVFWYFFSILCMRKFVLENVSVIRGAGAHHTALAALFLEYLTGIPACVSVHSDDDKRYEKMQKYGSIWALFNCRWLTVQVHKFVFSHARRVFIIRESLKDWVMRMGARPERIRLFPHGVNVDEFLRKYEGDIKSEFGLSSKRTVVFSGRLSRENYVYDIVKIAELVLRQISGVVFVMIGDGPERKGLEDLSNEKKLRGHIKFLGFQPQKKVYEFKKRADVNLCLMAGYSLIEAALSARPIVSYDVEWHYELVKDKETGFLIKEHDIGLAAKAIVTLLNDPELTKRLGDNAHHLAVEKHDIRKTDQQKIKLYEELKQTGVR